MKKYAFIMVALLISGFTLSQTKFNVPERTDNQKLQQAQRLGYNNIIAAINFAKANGLTAEEYSKYETKLFIPAWNKEMGFEGFVNALISMESAMVEKVEIVNQDDNKVIIKTSQIYPAFKSQGEILGVSYEEFMRWMETMYILLAEHLGCIYSQVIKDDGVEMTIAKK